MIIIKNKIAIQKMAMAGKLLSEIVADGASLVKEDASTFEIDAWIAQQISKKGLVSEMKGYKGYANVSCISVNDEVVHGVPSQAKILKNGDLVKIDVCASWKGYCADMARCFFVGDVSQDIKKMVEVAQASLDKGIEKARPGNRLSDISAAVQEEVERYGYGVVRDFAGHGIGKEMHEEPEIVNFGKPGLGPVLRAGMAFAIEPMITLGDYKVSVSKDGWTVKTADKSFAAHVEDTVVITEQGPYIITRNNQQDYI